jgi:2',3'-cyclic-nucleotide 2'-phosphodiesterase (5'-nucleotidase family)
MKFIKSHSLLIFVLLSAQFLFACSKTPYQLTSKSTQQYVFSDHSNETIDSSIIKFIAPYKQELDKTMNEELAYSKQALVKGLPESLLSNFAADAAFAQSKIQIDSMHTKQVDFVFLNSGGLRTSLPKGYITRENIFELMPFENELVILDLDSKHCSNLFTYIALRGGCPIAGLKLKINKSIFSSVEINGLPYDSTRTYRMITSDYLANGGDQCEFLKDIQPIKINLKVRDAFIRYLLSLSTKQDSLAVQLDGRITINN